MRLHTSGAEEVTSQSDISLTTWNADSGTINIVAPPVTRGQSAKCFQFPTATASWITRSLTNAKTSGSLWTRLYVCFTDWGGAANTAGAMVRWTNSGTSLFVLRFNASTRTFQIENDASGSAVTLDSTYAISLNKWYRVEIQIDLSTTTTGRVIFKIFDGDRTTALDTKTLSSQATMSSTLPSYTGIEIGNRGGTGWGTLHVDDIAFNDEDTTVGDNQISWCGPGCIFLKKPTSVQAVQWTGVGSTTNTALNVDEVPATPDDATTYNKVSDNVSVDRFNCSASPSALPDATQFTLIDLYARTYAAAASQTMDMSVWDDGGFRTDGPKVYMQTTWAEVRQSEHAAFDLTGVTKTQLDQYDIGYKALGGTSEKRVSTLWANVEYIPDISVVVSATKTCNYSARKGVSSPRVTNYTALSATAAAVSSEKSNYESLTTSTVMTNGYGAEPYGSVGYGSHSPGYGNDAYGTEGYGSSVVATVTALARSMTCSYEAQGSLAIIHTATSNTETLKGTSNRA